MSPAPVSTKLLVALGILVVLSGALYLWLQSSDPAGAPVVSPEDAWPSGRWHFRTPEAGAAGDSEELARALSLPYTGTGREASEGGEASGVLRHDPELAFQGVNLYTSGHAPEAMLLDMDGNLLHRWRLPFEEAFPERKPTVETAFFRRAYPLDDGALLVLYQGGGLAKLDRRSRVLWSYGAGLYNDVHVAADGRIYGLGKEARSIPFIHPTEPVLEDAVVVLDPDGRLERRVSLLQTLVESPFADLLQPMPPSGDIFHSNTVQLLEGGVAATVAGFTPDSVLVSMREIDLLAVVGLDPPVVRWARRGGWDAQHQPELLASGRMLLFDNLGAGGSSRVIEFEPLSGAIHWEYPGPSDPPLSSPTAGTAQRLDNGNTLITESEAGRAIEVTPEGAIVWEFVSPHRGGMRNELVAALFEVLRLPAAYSSTTPGGRPAQGVE